MMKTIFEVAVIEMNLNEWRDEILEQQDDDRAAREGGGA